LRKCCGILRLVGLKTRLNRIEQDEQTMFMLTGEYMRRRTNKNLIKVMKKSKFKVGDQVEIVTTDGLRGYPRMLRKTFSLQISLSCFFENKEQDNP
jgi:hypothetical protein